MRLFKSTFPLVLILTSAFAALDASAHNYTCADRNELAQILAELDRVCNTPTPGGACQARGYNGSTIESAIASCVQLSNGYWSESECNTHVTCTGSPRMYTARGYKGSTLELAVDSCKRLSNGYWSESECNTHVTGSAGAPLCTTRGYKGSTMEQAIDACARLSNGYWSRAECNTAVSCQ